MPAPAPPLVHGAEEMSTLQKLKMGAITGSLVGMSIGFIFGTFSVMTRGAGPNGALSQISQTMLASGATFGLFMSVGTVIRTEGRLLEPAEMQAYRENFSKNTSDALRHQLRLRFQQQRDSGISSW